VLVPASTSSADERSEQDLSSIANTLH
jgi:hypothetical protein